MPTIDTLPRWASTALATSCAESIVGSLGRFWPEMSTEDRQLVEDALNAAKNSAAVGNATDGLGYLANCVTRLTGRLELWLYAVEHDDEEMKSEFDLGLPPDAEPLRVKIASTIIDVAARSVRIAEIDDRDLAFSECGDALDWARAVMDHLPSGQEIEQELDRRIDSLWDFCEAGGMSDQDGIRLTEVGWLVSKNH